MRARPSDRVGLRTVSGNGRGNTSEGTNVGLSGPVEVEINGRGPLRCNVSQVFHREDFAGKKDQPQATVIVLLQISKLSQQAQNRRSGIPHGELVGSDKSSHLSRVLPQL